MGRRRTRVTVAVSAASVAVAVAVAVALGTAVIGAGPASASGARPGASRSVAGPIVLAAEPLPQPQQDPSSSRDKAREILDRSEFRRAEPGLFDRFRAWLSEGFARVLEGLFTGGVGSALSWGIFALAVAAVVFFAARFGRSVQHDPDRPDVATRVESRRSSVEWRHEAEACEARGQWKDALRCRYHALMADLVLRRVVRDLPGRTTGEYRADVAARLPDAAAEFAGASELFERAWYGDRPTGPDESERFLELADQVVARAGRPSRSHDVEVLVEEVSP
jgi:hypothetical protein